MIRDNIDGRLTRGLSPTGLANRIAWARANDFIPKVISAYGSAASPRFAVLLQPNPNKIVWNYALDTQAEFVDRLNVMAETGVRPIFVDHNGHGDFASVWRDNRVQDGYLAHVGLTSSGYQSRYNLYKASGYYPLMTMGGGSGSATRYTAIWVKNPSTIPFTFRKTGLNVSAMAGVDDWMEDFMRDNRIRGGQIAVARHGRLVHARGYTFAEPSYQTVLPTSLFRIASLHKPLTGILALRAVQEGRVSLDTKVWGNMNFTPFQDLRTRDVTVDHCLTHSGGWNRTATFDPMFFDLQIAPAIGANLPIDVQDIWRFMSSQNSLQFTPGTQNRYSNYGYALVGEVLENRYGQSYTSLIDEKIFDVLGLTRPRLGRSILPFRAPGEVRYHPTVPGVATTRKSASGVWVPRQYGGFNLENMEATAATSWRPPTTSRSARRCSTAATARSSTTPIARCSGAGATRRRARRRCAGGSARP